MLPPRSALYLPASNARAIEKARGLPCDLVILDLEDAVAPGMKDEARKGAVDAARQGMGKPVAIRINGPESQCHAADILAVRNSACDFVVLPKVERPQDAEDAAQKLGKPVMPMIETPRAVINAAAIAAEMDVIGLIAGTNDLAKELRLPPGAGRGGLSLSLQVIVLAARACGRWALDGVFNDLADVQGLEAECHDGRTQGFDGKTLIHPNQVDITNRAFSPSEAEIEDARALIDAASGGAERFRDRMIETLHVEMAKSLLARISRVS